MASNGDSTATVEINRKISKCKTADALSTIDRNRRHLRQQQRQQTAESNSNGDIISGCAKHEYGHKFNTTKAEITGTDTAVGTATQQGTASRSATTTSEAERWKILRI
jgi:hypothetical protein